MWKRDLKYEGLIWVLRDQLRSGWTCQDVESLSLPRQCAYVVWREELGFQWDHYSQIPSLPKIYSYFIAPGLSLLIQQGGRIVIPTP